MSAVYGIFGDPASAQRAVDALAGAGPDLHFRKQQIVVVSGEPFEGHDFADLHADTRLFALAVLGGAIGAICGIGLTALTQMAYPLPTGGMPIVPPWTNGIIIYELTMLGAIISTVITLLVSARLPRFKAPLTDAAIWEGKILVGVSDPPANSRAELETRLRKAGAVAVKEFHPSGKG